MAFALVLRAQPALPSKCCDENGVCRTTANTLAMDMIRSFAVLGMRPTDDAQATERYSMLLPQDQSVIQKVVSELETGSADFQNCVMNKINASPLSPDQKLTVVSWLSFFRSFNTGKPSLPSPNFQKGWDVFVSSHFFGGTKLFASQPEYVSMYAMHLGRTIGRKDPAKSRNFRWLVGASYYSPYKKVLLSPRLDVRVKDLEFSPANLGAIKTFVEVNFWEKLIINTGLSLETHLLSINLISIGYDGFSDGIIGSTGIAINLSDL
ncbi:MAG: hypothetical protein Tsb0034_06950 [Ekhidna sp.]